MNLSNVSVLVPTNSNGTFLSVNAVNSDGNHPVAVACRTKLGLASVRSLVGGNTNPKNFVQTTLGRLRREARRNGLGILYVNA